MSTRQIIFDYLTAAGMTLAGAAGAEANTWDESGDDPRNVEDRSDIPDDRYVEMIHAPGYDFETDNGAHYGFGLAQWTLASRKKNLMAYATGRGLPVESLQAQLEFLVHEMQTEFPGLWDYLCSTLDEAAAAERVCREYERPANTDYYAARRAQIARDSFKKLVTGHGTAQLPTDEGEPDEPDDPFWPPRTLDLSMVGADVMALQALLLARGYHNGGASGVFDKRTRKAVQEFQADSGLLADGVAGPITWRALLTL